MAERHTKQSSNATDKGQKSPRWTSSDNKSSAKCQTRLGKLFSLDPSLADFDYNSYEKEIMEYKKLNNYDFKSIVARTPPLKFEKVSISAFNEIQTPPQSSCSKSSVNVLKAAQDLDLNNNNETSSKYLKEPDKYSQASNHTDDFDEFSDYDMLEGDQDHTDDIRFWIDELSRQFKIDMKMVEKSYELDSIEKLREYNEVCSLWIKSIYEQNQILVDTMDEIKEAAQKDTAEFEERVTSLKQKIIECHSERNHWKAKAEGLEYETDKNTEKIKKLTNDIERLKEERLEKEKISKRDQKDLEALKTLIIRLRDGGTWDLDGLDDLMSTETFTKTLGSDWRQLCGMKLEGFDDLKKEKMELKEELASMKHEREHLRAKIFNKERNLHKLKSQEEAVKARFTFSKAEADSLRVRIVDLKCEEQALKELVGKDDTLDDFVKL